MKYDKRDIEALKSPDALHAYCAAALGAGKREGSVWKYPCPFGAHARPKLEVAEKGGRGVCLCRACNQGGTVFDVAAAVLGVDSRRDFARCVEEVAEKLNHRLTPADSSPRRAGRAREQRQKRVRMPHTTAAPASPAYLPPDDEATALDAVRRAAENPAMMAAHAAALGLPFDIVHCHTSVKEAGTMGLLGLAPDGRLIYVYTARDDAGRIRVQSTKTRNDPGKEPRFIQRGSKAGLWGAGALDEAPCRRVIITEGESDCLAVRAAFSSWHSLVWAEKHPFTPLPVEDFPLVLAKPDAGTFRASWAASLASLDVILVVDNDEAGRKGAEATASILRAAGYVRAFIWQPPPPHKDARAALDPSRPWLLAEDIITNKLQLQPKNI